MLRAMSALGSVKRPAAWPSLMSRSAQGARPLGLSRSSRPAPVMKRARSGWVQPSRPEMRKDVANTSAGLSRPAQAVDHLAPALQDLLRGGLEQFLLALEVVVEGPEADVGRFGDLLDAGAFAAALGDQPDRGVDQGLPGAGLAPVQPVGSGLPCLSSPSASSRPFPAARTTIAARACRRRALNSAAVASPVDRWEMPLDVTYHQN